MPNKRNLPVPSQVTDRTMGTVNNPETELPNVPTKGTSSVGKKTTQSSAGILTSVTQSEPGPDVPMTSTPMSASVVIDDSADDFLRWKRQFEEEKNNPLGIMDGISSANTTNSATSAQRLMIIGQI